MADEIDFGGKTLKNATLDATISGGGGTSTWKGDYNSLANYSLGDYVVYNGQLYGALQSSYGNTPSESPSQWALIGNSTNTWKGEWNSNTMYNAGDYVVYSSQIYVSTQMQSMNTPMVGSSFWSAIGSGGSSLPSGPITDGYVLTWSGWSNQWQAAAPPGSTVPNPTGTNQALISDSMGYSWTAATAPWILDPYGSQGFAGSPNNGATLAYSTANNRWEISSGGGSSLYAAGSGTNSIQPANAENNNAYGSDAVVSGGFANSAANYSAVVGGVSNAASGDKAFVGGGTTNTASGYATTIGGGVLNQATGSDSTVAGGSQNVSSGSNSFVGAGTGNQATGAYSVIDGGMSNTASGGYSAAVGGRENLVSGNYSTVSGGRGNTAGGVGPNGDGFCVIGGGWGNTATGFLSTIGGGTGNTTSSAYYATISGGRSNTASAYASTVGGGRNNTASGFASTVSGGKYNQSTAVYALIAGGLSNTASGAFSTIGGGNTNSATNDYTTVGGGKNNTASGIYSVIGGGRQNYINSNYGTIAGGFNNVAGEAAVASGGFYNSANGIYSGISAGYSNIANGNSATIGGGRYNSTGGDYSVIGGGWSNTASGNSSTVAGGRINTASGYISTISGGRNNTASAYYSTVSGGAGAVADQHGMRAFAAGTFASNGDAQHVEFMLRSSTQTGTLYLDGISQQIYIPSGKILAATVRLAGHGSAGQMAHMVRQFVTDSSGSGINAASNFSGDSSISVVGGDKINLLNTEISLDFSVSNNFLTIAISTNTTSYMDTNWRWVAHVDGIMIAQPSP